MFDLVTVGGHRSLRSLVHAETFHPGIGPMEEARVLHVEQQRLRERTESRRGTGPLVVWDVGLGAAANALAVVEILAGSDNRVQTGPRDSGNAAGVELHSFDLDCAALGFAMEHAGELVYPARWLPLLSELTTSGRAVKGLIDWHIHLGDFRVEMLDARVPAPDAVLFDPYSPTANPEMWTLPVFRAIRERAMEGCMLTCYSRSTAVRTSLLMAGWYVGRGSATGEKEETTVAATAAELLESPLEQSWLGRVARSTAPGPLGGAGTAEAVRDPMRGDEVAAILAGHAQFA